MKQHLIAVGILASLIPVVAMSAGPDSSLVGHWKLQTDCRDYSGMGNHGISHGLNFSSSGEAGFDGKTSYIEVASSKSLQMGKGDFSISAWIRTDRDLKDTVGDVACKYDPKTRKGLNFSVMNYAGVVHSQPNYRNILFGIDDGKIDPEWKDCGRPGNAVLPFSMAVFKGELYVGTFEWEADRGGHVYRYAGGTKWIDCGRPDPCNTVSSLAVYNGKLYAGVGQYTGAGSMLIQGDSPNTNPGDGVYRYEGGKKWVNCGNPCAQNYRNEPPGTVKYAEGISSLTVFNGRLYAIPFTRWQTLYRYDGGRDWTYCGNAGRWMYSTVFDGYLYGTYACFGRFDGSGFTGLTFPGHDVTQVYSFMAYEGRLHVSTWPRAEMFRYDRDGSWKSCGELNSEGPGVETRKEAMGMVVYNGKLYAGSLPMAKVYRYDCKADWTDVGQLDLTPDDQLLPSWPLRRAMSMAIYRGRLYCGVLPSGEVKSIEAGKCVTFDEELGPGWRHIVGIRDGRRLKLYVDGRLVSTSGVFDPNDYDISTTAPLRIGFGQHDYFNGSIRDLRIYNRALSGREVEALYAWKGNG